MYGQLHYVMKLDQALRLNNTNQLHKTDIQHKLISIALNNPEEDEVKTVFSKPGN